MTYLSLVNPLKVVDWARTLLAQLGQRDAALDQIIADINGRIIPTVSVPITKYGASTTASAVQNTAAINAALASEVSVLVPEGDFYVTQDAIGIQANNQEFYGAGPTSRLIITSPTGSVLKWTAGFTGTRLHHLQLVGPATGSTAGGLLDVSGAVVNECDFYNLSFIGGYDAVKLGVTAHSHFRQSYTSGQVNCGIRLIAGAGSRGELQWEINDVLAQLAGADGITVEAGGGAPGITLGAWNNVSSFACSGHGTALYGSSSCPIFDLDWTGGTCGSNGASNGYLDTYGRNNRLENVLFERAGMDSTGQAGSTAASGVGAGIEITRNNDGVQLVNCAADFNAFDGVYTSGSGIVISNLKAAANGLGATASSLARNAQIFQLAGSLGASNISADGRGVSAYLLRTYNGSGAAVFVYLHTGHTVTSAGSEALFYCYTNSGALQTAGGVAYV